MNSILVFGDSICYGKWDKKGGWVQRVKQTINSKKVSVYNLGIPGEVSTRLTKRFKNELKYRISPNDNNIVIVSVGINDSNPNNWRTGKQTTKITFVESIIKIITVAKSYNCKVVIVSLLPVNKKHANDQGFSNKSAKIYNNYLKESCKKTGAYYLNLFNKLLKNNYTESLVDMVHPNNQGHKIIAKEVVSFLNEKSLIKYET